MYPPPFPQVANFKVDAYLCGKAAKAYNCDMLIRYSFDSQADHDTYQVRARIKDMRWQNTRTGFADARTRMSRGCTCTHPHEQGLHMHAPA
jgi:hypothetical protein